MTSLNVAAINSSLAEAGVLDSITTSVASEVQDIIDTWAKVEALADGEVDTVTIGTSVTDIVPTLTGGSGSQVSGGGFTVTTSSPYTNNDYLISGAFDDSTNFYASGSSLPTVNIVADKPYAVSGFAITDVNGAKQWLSLIHI